MGVISSVAGNIPGVSTLTSIGGSALGKLGGINNPFAVPTANQDAAQGLINQNSTNSQNYLQQQAAQQQAATNYQQQAANYINNQSQNAIQQAQNYATGGNVQNSLNYLQQQAAGTAPTAATGILQQGTDQAIQTQQAMANSGNLSQMIGGQRNAMANAAHIQEANANVAGQLAAQQQVAGSQNYANASAAQSGQLAQNAALQQNQAAGLSGLSGQANQAAQGYTNAANSASGQALQGQLGTLGISQGAQTQQAMNQSQAIGGALNAIGGAGTAFALKSDPKAKKNLHEATPKQIRSLLALMDKDVFEYKDSDGAMGQTPGKHVGTTTTSLEKSPLGASMVVDTGAGKAIDIPSAVGTLMAAMSDMNDRFSDMEDYFRKKKKTKGDK